MRPGPYALRVALSRRPTQNSGQPTSLFASLAGQERPDALLTFVALLATGAVATLGAIAVFRTSDRRAKDRGLLDQTTGS